MTSPRQPDTCKACPMYGKGKGFLSGQGDPNVAKLTVLLDMPTYSDVFVRLNDDELTNWALRPFGLGRQDIFLDHLLRCSATKYPTGDERKAAEAHCRQYDRHRADVGVVSLDPHQVHAEPAPLPMQLRSFEKALSFARDGQRVLVTAGNKAAEWWFCAPRTANRWVLHYEFENEALRQRREDRRARGMAMKVGKAKKLTLKQHLKNFVDLYDRQFGEDGNYHAPANYITPEQRDEILALLVTKKRTGKVAE